VLPASGPALGRDKPFWVTEWGFLNPKAFPTASGLTFPQALQEFLGGFKSLSREMPIGPIMFYRYDVFLTDEAGNWLPGAHVFESYANGR